MMRISIILMLLVLLCSGCAQRAEQSPTSVPDEQPTTPEPSSADIIVPKNYSIQSSEVQNNMALMHSARGTEGQGQFLMTDDHIGKIKVVPVQSSFFKASESTELKNLCASSFTEIQSYDITPFRTMDETNDSGDEYIKIDNGSMTLDIDAKSGAYEHLRIISPDIAIRSMKDVEFKVGDKIDGLREHYSAAYEKSKKIDTGKEIVTSTLINLSEFIGEKSDIFLYIYHQDGIIKEIGTWEQY